MSRQSGIFLRQLRSDLEHLCQDSGKAGKALLRLSGQIDLVESNGAHPVALDAEQERLQLFLNHPLVKKLVENPLRRRSDTVFFISSMMSLLNREREEITDDDEREFHARLLQFALTECRGSWGAVD